MAINYADFLIYISVQCVSVIPIGFVELSEGSLFIVHLNQIEHAIVIISFLPKLFYCSLLGENLVLVGITHTNRYRKSWLVLDHGPQLDAEI